MSRGVDDIETTSILSRALSDQYMFLLCGSIAIPGERGREREGGRERGRGRGRERERVCVKVRRQKGSPKLQF